jgi:flagellin
MPNSLVVATNVSSIIAQKNVSATSRGLQQSITRLSSGLRLNSSADDAAGMAVSTGLRAQLGGFKQAIRNANDGVAILQTAEGAYNTIGENLMRMRDLAVQASNDGLTDKERQYIKTEFQDIQDDIDRISKVTEYNGIELLDGKAGDGSGKMTFQVGTRNSSNDQINITLKDMGTASAALNVAKTTTGVSTLAQAQSAITEIDNAIDFLSTERTQIGSKLNKLGNAVTNLSGTVENLSQANSQIRDVDMASESAAFAGSQVLQQAGVSMLAQANQMPNLALRLLG